jgi:D-xylose transport system substrate-binding protein
MEEVDKAVAYSEAPIGMEQSQSEEGTMRMPRLMALPAIAAIILAACTAPGATGIAGQSGAAATECSVGVSWNNFQQPRWAATDAPKMEQTIVDGGGTFTDFDADLDSVQQLTDVETLINQGIDVLVLLPADSSVVGPALQQAADAGIPVIAYDRLVEDPSVLYITFDNIAVGRAEAEALFEKVPTGNYVLIKGHPGDPNASTFLPLGWDQAGLQDKIDSGEITIEADQFTDDWDTELAQNNMEAIIDAANADGDVIDAVLAENDSTALGVAAALQAKNYDPYPPVSGQDGDPANLNNLAKGLQYVDVWKDSNELGKVAGAAALQLCAGTPIGEVTLPDGLINESVAPVAGNTAADFTTPGPDSEPDSGDENVVKSFILQPQPLLAEDLQLVIDAGWYATQEDICEGVTADDPGAAVCGL